MISGLLTGAGLLTLGSAIGMAAGIVTSPRRTRRAVVQRELEVQP